jgi:DnaJ-class molecular chaperone
MGRKTETCGTCSGTGDKLIDCPQCSATGTYNGKTCDACTNGKYAQNCGTCGGEGIVVVITDD